MGYVSDMWPSMQSMAGLGGCCESSTMKGSPSWGRYAVTSTSSARPDSFGSTENFDDGTTTEPPPYAGPCHHGERMAQGPTRFGLATHRVAWWRERPLTIEALSACVWLWDGQEDHARRWHLYLRREIDRPDTVKFALSNATADTSLHQLASMQAVRFWIEHALREAKDCLGMAQYQVRKWNGWHHHMALVMLAMNFLLKERLAHRVAGKDLTLSGPVFSFYALLAHPAHDPDSVAELIAERHQRRQSARDSAYRKQNAALLNPSAE